MNISPAELLEISELIHKQCGIVLDSSKGYLIESRLRSLLTEMNLTSYHDLCVKANQSSDLVNKLIDQMTTNETSFFRDIKPFKLLREKILTDWFKFSDNSHAALNIWSSACSTGQEAYSIAIILKEFFGINLPKYMVKITGTDIADSVITKARYGKFSQMEVSRGLAPEFLPKYFTEDGAGWRINDELRNLVSFKKQNLLHDFAGLDKFDIIFCRNVAIYFSTIDRQALFNRLADQLLDHGILIIGSTESLFGITDRFARHEYQGATYYTKKR